MFIFWFVLSYGGAGFDGAGDRTGLDSQIEQLFLVNPNTCRLSITTHPLKGLGHEIGFKYFGKNELSWVWVGTSTSF